MGSQVYPAAASGGIKSVQRGTAASSGSVTITSVNTSKAFVNIFGSNSSGAVAATGTLLTSGSFGLGAPYGGGGNGRGGATASPVMPDRTFSGGTNTLVSAVVQGYLQDSVTLVVSGACRYEVIEFN